jgi:voltage-gated potassium channel
MDLAVGIAMGSCIQIALFVTPVLVLSSALIAPERLTLEFSRVEIGAPLVQGRPAPRVLPYPRGHVLPDPAVSPSPRGSAFAPGRFRLLLLSLLLFFGGTAATTGTRVERLVEVALLTLVIVAAVLDLGDRGHRGRFAVGLAGGVILVSVADLNVQHLPGLVGAMVVLFAGLVVWRAYTAVMRPQRSVGDRIVGAICVYVLIGLAWAKIYETLDDIAPGSFRFPADTAWATPSLLRYGYFSFVTLATLGYGDVTPVTAMAGTLAWMEAISGQLYLAITISRLVALSMADSSGPDPASRA